MKSFSESLHVVGFANAEFFAANLFYESFAIPFPVPRDNCGLSIPTPPDKWRQYVAFYKWSDAEIEPVGFCNWIRYGDVYLEGGLCVKRNFYRRFGHANTGMLFKVYSKWIDGADNARERAKLDAAFVHDWCTPRRMDVTTN